MTLDDIKIAREQCDLAYRANQDAHEKLAEVTETFIMDVYSWAKDYDAVFDFDGMNYWIWIPEIKVYSNRLLFVGQNITFQY